MNNLRYSLKKVPLTKEQERDLILCIRFSYLSHPELTKLINDPIIGEYKDLLLQALSIRLKSYENTQENDILINLNPRKYLSANQNNNINNNNNLEVPYNQTEMNINLNNRYGFEKNERNDFYNKEQQNDYNLINRYSNDLNINDSNRFKNIIPNTTRDYESRNQFISSTQNFIDNQRKDNNLYRSQNNPRPPQDPKISIDFYKNMSMINKPHPIFKYEYDFDENGIFYYLGTKGKIVPYKNPHEIGQIKVFASSLGKGNLSDFVGRNLVNLRTQNEENSFFGVDLGNERFLIPSSYSIKNRNSSSHVMLCWNLEGSNDKINYEVLDTRIFSNNVNSRYHNNLEKERNMLKQPGCTSTWGVSKRIKEKFPKGFRYFILKQIDKNSSGGYNLALSGFEIYGEGIGRNWNLS